MDLDPVQPRLAQGRTNPASPACPAPIKVSFPNPITPKAGFPTELRSHPLQTHPPTPPPKEPCLPLEGNRMCGQTPRPGKCLS